jgi:hypothetical protein
MFIELFGRSHNIFLFTQSLCTLYVSFGKIQDLGFPGSKMPHPGRGAASHCTINKV